MTDAYSKDNLLEFLDHAGDRGLMPAATAQAIAVATRNVLGVLSDQENTDLSQMDIPSVIKRFNNKRAKDFNPSSLKEYGRRLQKAIDLYQKWREDPANFEVKTRATSVARKKDKTPDDQNETGLPKSENVVPRANTYQTAVPVRPGVVVTLVNIPYDLSSAEANRLATFINMLAISSQSETNTSTNPN